MTITPSVRPRRSLCQPIRSVILWLLLIAATLISGCAPRQPSQPFTIDRLLIDEEFAADSIWEAYADPAIKVDLRVADGAYRIEARDGGFMWGLGGGVLTDTVIEVESEQLSDYADNAYGVMCRASPSADGDGYYFLISGDGYYTIRRGAGREIAALIPWTAHEAIRKGQTHNRIRAVCLGDYLALFVNDQFVDETHDHLYRQGLIGLAAGVPDGGEVIVTFDDLLVFAAVDPAASPPPPNAAG